MLGLLWCLRRLGVLFCHCFPENSSCQFPTKTQGLQPRSHVSRRHGTWEGLPEHLPVAPPRALKGVTHLALPLSLSFFGCKMGMKATPSSWSGCEDEGSTCR